MFCGLKKEKFSVLNKYVTLLNEFLSVFTFNFQNPNVGETIDSIFEDARNTRGNVQEN